MGWETVKGRRYFYETTVESGERVRRCHGSGVEAHQAAARVEQEQRIRAHRFSTNKKTENAGL